MLQLIIKNPRWFRYGIGLAVFALLMQLLTPLVHYGSQKNSSYHSRIGVLCTSLIHTISTATTKNPKHEKGPSPSCPLCQAFQLLSGGFSSPAVFLVVGLLGLLLQTLTVPDTSLRPFKTIHEGRPRGPPSLLAKPV